MGSKDSEFMIEKHKHAEIVLFNIVYVHHSQFRLHVDYIFMNL